MGCDSRADGVWPHEQCVPGSPVACIVLARRLLLLLEVLRCLYVAGLSAAMTGALSGCVDDHGFRGQHCTSKASPSHSVVDHGSHATKNVCI